MWLLAEMCTVAHVRNKGGKDSYVIASVGQHAKDGRSFWGLFPAGVLTISWCLEIHLCGRRLSEVAT